MGVANSTDLEARIASFDPSDPDALAALENDVLGSEVPVEEPASSVEPETSETKEPAKQDDKTGTEAAAKVQTEPNSETDATSGVTSPKGVMAKDGDHIIPYSVLERERERAIRAEATIKALSEQINALQSGADTEAKPANAEGQLSEQDLAQLDSDLPGVAKVIRAQMAAIQALTGTVQTLQQENEIAQNTRAASVQDETEAAIQSNPELVAWREAANRKDSPDPRMWNRAADLDAVLRSDDEWKDRPIAERFAKVTETIKTLYGAPSAAPAPTIVQPQQAKPVDLKQVADTQLEAIPAPVPTTLSDIPGGAAPAQSDIETLENASAVALGQKFMSMSPDQMESYLARLGV